MMRAPLTSLYAVHLFIRAPFRHADLDARTQVDRLVVGSGPSRGASNRGALRSSTASA